MHRQAASDMSFGCLSVNAVIAGVITLVVVTLVWLFRGGLLFSPGGLNAQAGLTLVGGVTTHADIVQCAGCHAPFWSASKMQDLCLACHKDVSDARNFHQTLFTQNKNQNCNTCHTEHHGPAASLTTANLATFPHDSTGFSLKAHPKMADGTPFKCSDCHKSYITFDQVVCANCHQKINPAFASVHTAAYGTKCTTCHDGIDSYGHAFNHQVVPFQLTGKHAPLDCGKCHQGARSIADLKSTSTTCFACHQKDDAHQGQFGQDCQGCHTTSAWKPAKFDHATTAFPIAGKHVSVACASCHANNVFKGTPTACYACHAKDDQHQGAFGQDCSLCHVPDGWLPPTFDHSKSAFPLTGKHLTSTCVSCHINNIFKGTPTLCYACHAKDDTHKGQLGQDCSLCHTAAGWLPSTFNHSKTVFPLTGAHANLDCTRCHVKDASGTIIFKGTPTACVSCHNEPVYHLGLFGTSCATCHNTATWSPAKFNGPHTFPINHGGASSCHSCHPASLRNYTCFTCHNQADTTARHAQEGMTNIANCVSCHANGRGGDNGGGG